MKFSVAAVALAAGASASYPAVGNNVTYTTEVVTAITTYCPASTTITYGSKTYTVTKPTTLTITDCPCTVSKPVYTTSTVVCSTCTAPTKGTTTAPGVTTYPGSSAPPANYPTTVPSGGNGTVTSVKPSQSTGSVTVPPSSIPTAGAGKAAALSGAGLAGVMGLFAYVL